MVKIHFVDKPNNISGDRIIKVVTDSLSTLKINKYELEIEIVFASPSKIKSINKKYRDKDEITDVLSFPQVDINSKKRLLGSIVIIQKISNTSAVQLVLHGLLHLLGYDHDTNLQKWNKAAKLINHQ